jgi:hypothetical protein
MGGFVDMLTGGKQSAPPPAPIAPPAPPTIEKVDEDSRARAMADERNKRRGRTAAIIAGSAGGLPTTATKALTGE